jgi:hypothetical protein
MRYFQMMIRGKLMIYMGQKVSGNRINAVVVEVTMIWMIFSANSLEAAEVVVVDITSIIISKESHNMRTFFKTQML